MKATVDIPEDLYRRLKAKSALEGRPIRSVVVELVQRWVDGDAPATGRSPDEWLDEWLRLGNELSRNAPPGPTATEILEADRGRLERP